MVWVIVLIVIAVLGVAMLVSYAVWLAHKTSDVFGELSVLGDRLGQFGQIIARLEFPEPGFDAGAAADQDKIVSATNDVR